MSETESELTASAAQLYYVDGLGQSEIATMLGVSRPKVSRLLAAARETGIVRISVAPYEPRNVDLERRLRERFDLRLAVVVKVFGDAPHQVRRAVGHYAAPALSALIRSEMTIGVAGGRTLGNLIHSMTFEDRPEGVRVLQLMGHIDPNARHMDAPELGRVLAEHVGGTFSTLAAPAIASDRWAREAFLSQPQIEHVHREFDRLDLALVGVGVMRDSVFAERGVLDHADYASLEALGAVGEICGRFFDRNGHQCVSDYRDRVIGIDLEQLRGLPEVVAVTNGATRSTAILAAIRGNLITSLIIDDDGAAALLHAADTMPAPGDGATVVFT